jgi:hypothetical protein
MFSRALALLAKIQDRLALDRGSALSRARAESVANGDTAKPVASTEFHSTQDGTSKTAPANLHPSSHPAEAASRRRRKPVQLDSPAPKRTRAKASAPTRLQQQPGKTGKK